MKTVNTIKIAAVIMALAAGCEPDGGTTTVSPKGTIPAGVERGFAPARIQVIGLTEITSSDAATLDEAKVSVYIDLVDAYGSRIKSPGKFRFELYEFLPLASDPRGDRLILWPDIDLNDSDRNNSYWRDYLRTYQFELNARFKPRNAQTFILEATFITARGKFITTRYKLLYEE